MTFAKVVGMGTDAIYCYLHSARTNFDFRTLIISGAERSIGDIPHFLTLHVKALCAYQFGRKFSVNQMQSRKDFEIGPLWRLSTCGSAHSGFKPSRGGRLPLEFLLASGAAAD